MNAFCSGLAGPIDNLADTLIENELATPDAVIVSATKVILGYDGGCNG